MVPLLWAICRGHTPLGISPLQRNGFSGGSGGLVARPSAPPLPYIDEKSVDNLLAGWRMADPMIGVAALPIPRKWLPSRSPAA